MSGYKNGGTSYSGILPSDKKDELVSRTEDTDES